MSRQDWDRKDIISRIDQAKGNLAAVARSLGVSRTTVWRYIQDKPTVQQAVDEARETMLDNAESVLYKKVLDGDMTAVIFFLKTQGHKRGYTERHEVSGPQGGAIPVQFIDYRQGLQAPDDSTEAET